MKQIPAEQLVDTPFAGLTVFEAGDDAPEGAVCRTETQFLDENGQPLAPPPGHEEE